MEMRARMFYFSLTLFLSIAGRRTALASECDPERMALGKTTAEVASRCGEPVWRERWSEERFVETAPRPLRRELLTFEEWVYDFGPSKFIRILHFKNDLLIEVKTGGYGFPPEAPADFGCERTIVSSGETKWEVRMKCGEPTTANPADPSWRENDTWVYNLGSTRLIRTFRFKNGRLMQIETGGFGD
ncbi:MAG: DUF2845 domain-containing protein [Minisyncoccia bacterium]